MSIVNLIRLVSTIKRNNNNIIVTIIIYYKAYYAGEVALNSVGWMANHSCKNYSSAVKFCHLSSVDWIDIEKLKLQHILYDSYCPNTYVSLVLLCLITFPQYHSSGCWYLCISYHSLIKLKISSLGYAKPPPSITAVRAYSRPFASVNVVVQNFLNSVMLVWAVVQYVC